MKKKQKQLTFIIIGFFSILIIASIFNNLVFLSTNKGCGIFIKTGTSRYVEYIHYSYIVDGKEYTGSVPKKQLKNSLTLDDLKGINCIEIEYSSFFYSYSRVTDTLVIDNGEPD